MNGSKPNRCSRKKCASFNTTLSSSLRIYVQLLIETIGKVAQSQMSWWTKCKLALIENTRVVMRDRKKRRLMRGRRSRLPVHSPMLENTQVVSHQLWWLPWKCALVSSSHPLAFTCSLIPNTTMRISQEAGAQSPSTSAKKDSIQQSPTSWWYNRLIVSSKSKISLHWRGHSVVI